MTRYCVVTEEQMQEIVELIKRFRPVSYKDAQHHARVLQLAKASLENSVEVAGYRVTGRHTDQPFNDRSLADSYRRGFLKTDPKGGYEVSPLIPVTKEKDNEH